ncbi:amino acid ABC transporter permease [Hydrogenibacillus sp. N12]|uniref:amino acid ABC transporter permease n=1 Tax=Hydrogenibacillus sp. N12 TaxID=2866627 RepID=UPI001C7D333D|nr:amino acid ABC transporter permease [Hydrogenibacillus sp. N12]QZA32588.1 amino acid ABC transporter permease [Hydrogenibacillus sp. N12]
MDFRAALTPEHILFMLDGFRVTLIVAASAIVLSFLFGTVIAVFRYAQVPVLAPVLGAVVEALRNLPLLLIIIFTRFALPDIGIRLDVVASAIVALTVFEMAMISEIIRGGLLSVDKGQIEAARSTGLTAFQTLRYIVLPQALVRMIPPTVSQFISLLKDTSLAVAIALPELLHNSKIIYNANPSRYVVPVLLFAGFLYFITNFSLSQLALTLERRLRIEH